MYKAGRYDARIVDYGITEIESTGNTYVAILLEFTQDGERKEITYFGFLSSEKSRKHTFDALTNCGFKGTDLSVLADGVQSGALDHETPVNIVIEQETYEGKTRWRVRWINRRAAFRSKIDRAEAKSRLGALSGELAAYRRENGQAPQKEKINFSDDVVL